MTLTVGASSTYLYVTNGTVGTTIALSPTATIGTLKSSVEAATNSAGVKTLSVDIGPSLTADTVSNNLLAATVTIPANKHTYVDGPTWDTSNALFYDTYCPGSSMGGVGNGKILTRLHGDCAGTGNITIKGYIDATQVYQKVIVSPVYVSAASSSSTNYTTEADAIGPAQVDLVLDIPVAQSGSLMVRASCGTSATTGGLGMVLDLVP